MVDANQEFLGFLLTALLFVFAVLLYAPFMQMVLLQGSAVPVMGDSVW